LGEEFVVFLQDVAVGRFADDRLDTGWQELCMSDVSWRIFEEAGCQLTEQLVMVGCACDTDGVCRYAFGGGSVNKFRREEFKGWYKRDDLVAAVHGVFVVGLCVWGHLDNFFFCHRDGLEGVEEGVAEGSAMGDSRMNIDQIADGTSHMVSDGIDGDEDFVFFQPLENGGGGIGALFHLGDGLRRTNDAANGYEVVRFSRRIVNREEFFEFPFVVREFVVAWIVGVFLVDR